MPKKYTISYHEAISPITNPVTKFGGHPIWVDEPSWPLSRSYGSPMQFICQIALPADLFGGIEPRMAYLFVTDDYKHGYRADTWEPEGGENALILQPGGAWEGTTLLLREGPTLYRRTWTGIDCDLDTGAGWERTPCEFAVELHPGEDPADGLWDIFPQDEEAQNAYWAAVLEDKIGGTPVPTPFGPRFSSGLHGMRLLLQLNAKDKEGNGDPFFLNLSYDGVGYAFLSQDGRRGQFLWSR